MSAIQNKQIMIEPNPAPDAYSSTSVDLRLSDKFSDWQSSAGVVIRPGAQGYKYTSLLRHQNNYTTSMYTLKPRGFVLAWTIEEVSIPNQSRLAARVEGKSSMARLGIGVHITAPTIHCGFQGPVQLEMYNFGPHEVILDAGMPICQLIFEVTLGTPDKGYQGMFFNQAPKP